MRRGGDGVVLNWAIGIDMYTLMYIKLMTNKNLLYKKINKIKLKKKKSFRIICALTLTQGREVPQGYCFVYDSFQRWVRYAGTPNCVFIAYQ